MIFCIYIYIVLFLHSQSGKTTVIRLTAVRQTNVSRHHGGPINGLPEIPRTSQSTILLRGLKGALNCLPLCRQTLVSRTVNVSFASQTIANYLVIASEQRDTYLRVIKCDLGVQVIQLSINRTIPSIL